MDRDRESLRLAVEDVNYEFEQLVNLAREMARQDDQFKSPSRGALEYDVTATISIACLESALLHVRNLLAFLDPSQESWINIRDYGGKLVAAELRRSQAASEQARPAERAPQPLELEACH